MAKSFPKVKKVVILRTIRDLLMDPEIPNSEFTHNANTLWQDVRVLVRTVAEKRRQEAMIVNEKKRQKDIERERIVIPKIVNWVEHNVEPGMLLKMKGTRDRIGLREVIEIHPDQKRLVCYKITLPYWYKTMEEMAQVPIREQITDHGFDKVQGVVEIVPAGIATPKNRWIVTSVRDILRDRGEIT